MVTVPFFCPDVPPLKSNPVFLFYSDSFQKPNPFQPDVVVAIDAVIEKKLDALDALESQFYEGGALGRADLIPSDPTSKQADRRRQVRGRSRQPQPGDSPSSYRDRLARLVRQGARPRRSQHAEAFEMCEYGRRPDKKELARLFPFFGE